MALLSHPAVLRGLLGGVANAAQGFGQERDLRRQANRTRATEDYKTRLGMMEKDWEQQLREKDPLRLAQLQNTQAQGGLIQAQTTATQALGVQRENAGPLSEALRVNKEEAEKLKAEQKKQEKAAKDAEREEEKRQKAQEKLEEKSLELQGTEHALSLLIGERDDDEVIQYAISHPEVLATPTWRRYQGILGNPAGATPLGAEVEPVEPMDLTGVKGVPVPMAPLPGNAGTVDPLTGVGGGGVSPHHPRSLGPAGAAMPMPADAELSVYVGRKPNPMNNNRPFQSIEEVKAYLFSKGYR